MPALARSTVTLRIFGKDLNPDEISRRLGATPTRARVKGPAQSVTGSPDSVHIPPYGSWHLEAAECRPEDVNGQVDALLAQLTNELAVWASITSDCKVDIFCGLFMNGSNEGFSLSPETMSALASRNIRMSFDVYANDA
jgi:hypothetical protein